jgi:hypothetical protein
VKKRKTPPKSGTGRGNGGNKGYRTRQSANGNAA